MAGRTHLVLREEDVVKLVCEFLENRAMTISQISLERESGVINGDLSDDIVFLRKILSNIDILNPSLRPRFNLVFDLTEL